MSETDGAGRQRVWRPGRPVPVDLIWGPLRRGPGDPSFRRAGTTTWRATATPCGPVTLAVVTDPSAGEVRTTAWGAGADWALDALPRMLGDDDDPSGFRPRHPVVVEAWRRHGALRVPTSGVVWESLLAAVLEQKVTGKEAFEGWRRLLLRHGDPAPGPGTGLGMRVPPRPERVRLVPSWEWLAMQVDGARSRTIVAAAARGSALERTLTMDGRAAEAALTSLPGIGVWTAAEVRQRAHGDPDAVSVGDYHLAGSVTLALAGEPGDDAAMVALLEDYRPHRYRVQRLVELARVRVPRHGPRMAPRRHLPGRPAG